jgi:hypothetical protein
VLRWIIVLVLIPLLAIVEVLLATFAAVGAVGWLMLFPAVVVLINSDEMLQHGIEKVVYGVTLTANSYRYLLRLDDVPRYLFSLDDPRHSTARIGQYWFERWASGRMRRDDTEQKLLAHTLVRPIRHGARVVLPSDESDQLAFRVD